MPNHVQNRLTLTGPEASIARFKTMCLRSPVDEPDGSETFDFNAVIPTPAGLDDEQHLSWTVENWGTKWNAYEMAVWQDGFGCLEITFQTAWSTPEPVFVAVAKEFPDLAFKVVSFDESWNSAYTGKGSGGQFVGEDVPATEDLYEEAYGEKPEDLADNDFYHPNELQPA